MVRIEKIVMEGFKSFKRKVAVPFPEGFSVLTGPNGSGKTNIADAIYFVLGSGAASSLRAKKAHEVIFQGNAKRGPSGYASVTMHLDNRDRGLPIDEDMITVSRRVNKAGASTYRLAGRVSSKQEVMDFLSQVGITADGHNMIQQGDVTKIVEMGPVERRGMLDEIAGITDYDEKKERAMKELSKVAEKVREAEIVLEQKDEIMQKIKAERDAALEYRRLQGTLKLVVASSILKNLKSLEKKADGSGKGTGGLDAQIETISGEISEAEKKISSLRSEMEGVTGKIMKASDVVEEAGRISELRARIEMKTERVRMNDTEIGRIADMIEKLSTLEKRESPAVKAVISMPGVEGTFSDLLMVPPHYKTAVEVAAGGHLSDVVVENHHQAAECIKFLKSNRVGRARFLPMDKIAQKARQDLPSGAIGWLSDLVHNDPRYHSIVSFVLGSTACVKDIDTAKEMMSHSRHRMVTLDGDLIETSGAMTGGFYARRGGVSQANIGNYTHNRKELEHENRVLHGEIEKLKKELSSLDAGGGVAEGIKALEERRFKISRDMEALRERREKLYEKRSALKEEAGRMSVRQARYEAGIETARMDWEKYRDMEKEIEESGLLARGATELEEKKAQIISRMDQMGPVNMKAIAEFETFRTEFDEFRAKVEKVTEEKNAIEATINEIENKKMQVFTATMGSVSGHFRQAYRELTGGEADLRLGARGDLDSGLMIYASPPGKRLVNIDAMSAGEKTLTAFAFLFAIQNHRPAPFYIFDESDSSLDKSNTKRVAELIKKHSKAAQFIIISHNDQLIKEASHVYGVSMEQGESKIIGVHLPDN